MIVYCVSFGSTYKRFARVLGRSVADNCPDARFVHEQTQPAGMLPYAPKHATDNTRKLEAWNAFAREADDDLVLLDADMVVLRDLSAAFVAGVTNIEGQPFDVAYTTRPGPRLFQGGAIYLRPTQEARDFMQMWVDRNACILNDRTQLHDYIQVYGGVNQAALATVVKQAEHEAVLAQLPCRIYNSCKQTWETFSPDTAVVHVTGRLRRQACACRMPPSNSPEWTVQERAIIASWLYYT